MANLARIIMPVVVLAVLIIVPVFSAELKCWTCSSDLYAPCKDKLVANGTADPRMRTCDPTPPYSTGNEVAVCMTQIDSVDGQVIVSRGCMWKNKTETSNNCVAPGGNNKTVFCETCTASGCNKGGCDNKTCEKSAAATIGKSVVLIIAPLVMLAFK